ncbi:ribonuclease M5 [Salsuginibacillus kocurii]|uniref:ribonuclease M5 n=1 Tax=Salsuginibacillus kocurii TaxID=427078 RepID=UPI000381B1AA|nr:ribonuclease M5 [Salsuginibacillus kocurii]
MIIHECIVVEGKDDTVAIKRAVQADTIETNGSAVPLEVLEQIKLASERRGVIIFTDPDAPGERVRRIVREAVPGCKHAFLPREEALNLQDSDLGVENASVEAIQQALLFAQQEHGLEDESAQQISRTDLIEANLLGSQQAKKRREHLGKQLRIGYANGKQLEKRLRMFRIQREEFFQAVQAIDEGEEIR